MRIDVYDTGLGIPQSKKRDIFEEFHRLDQGAKVARGLGLGLSIVERIARVLDASDRCRSATRVGGSHFSVEVPRSNAAPVELPQRGAASVDPGQLAGIAVLCIDNEPAVLDGMETLLGGWGCDVLKAPDLDLALAALAQSPHMPNGLLVDYHLDHGNGIEAIAELRRRFGADLPAILITADRSPARARRGARARRPGAEQAAQAGGAARAAGAMARAAGGGGGVDGIDQPISQPRALRPWPTSILAAAITACVRLSTPSFCRIAETCAFTVASETRARRRSAC